MTRGQGGGPKRRKPADLHTVHVNVSLTPAEAARLDAVRGEEARAAVLRTGGMAEVARRESARKLWAGVEATEGVPVERPDWSRLVDSAPVPDPPVTWSLRFDDGTEVSGTAPTQPEAEAAARAALGEYARAKGGKP